MSDDFRVRITLADRREAVLLGERLERGDLEQPLAAAGAADRIAASIDEHDVFLYADTREQAESAADAVRSIVRREGWRATVEVARWHPSAEEWEDPDKPLPASDAERAAERAELVEQERAESAAWGIDEYEVRVQCASHRDTLALHERLRAEGLPSVRRWRYLLVGCPDEASAQALADRLSGEAPSGSTVTVEASLAAIARETPANPFAVFGGLGG